MRLRYMMFGEPRQPEASARCLKRFVVSFAFFSTQLALI